MKRRGEGGEEGREKGSWGERASGLKEGQGCRKREKKEKEEWRETEKT